ncbi:MAG: hypothetical protein ACI9CO_000110 [Candidatus Azotimanducaceae bacterium]|jgi:hypothetical protein
MDNSQAEISEAEERRAKEMKKALLEIYDTLGSEDQKIIMESARKVYVMRGCQRQIALRQ